MVQPRQHIRSARAVPVPATARNNTTTVTANDTPTTQPDPSITIHKFPINYIFMDDTGRFTPRARSGNQYVMVALHSESNAILVQPFQTKADAHRIAAYNSIFERLKGRHATPDTHVLDNQASRAFLQTITNNGCHYQLVPPHVHRRNRAERAIRTFKDHFLAILAGTNPTFPRNCWDLLLPQAELTLNLLQPSPQPTMSAWHHLFGPYNFDATPMGPAGCRVLIHTKASIRRLWENRCHEGFYIGPSLVHYRCYRVLNTHSGAVTISDAIKFRHHYLPTPELSTADKLLHAVQAIHNTIAQVSPATNSNQLAAIEALRAIIHSYKCSTESPPTMTPPPGVAPTRPVATPPGVAPTRLVAIPPGVAPTPRTATPPGVQPQPNNDWITVPTRPERGRTTTTNELIAQRTRARTQALPLNAFANAFAVLADKDDDDKDDTSHADSKHPLIIPKASIPVHFAGPVFDATSGKQLEHRQLHRHPTYKEVWDTSYANELGRLCQGIGQDKANPAKQRVEGTNTFRPIKLHDIPIDRRGDVTYTKVVCEVRPQKEDPNRTRITIGGNRTCYPGDTGTPTGSLELVKLQVNARCQNGLL
jgi:hypothetical protein